MHRKLHICILSLFSNWPDSFRASTCLHLQCFDASLFLQMNERKPTWNCPVCDKPALYETLVIDGYVSNDVTRFCFSCGLKPHEYFMDWILCWFFFLLFLAISKTYYSHRYFHQTQMKFSYWKMARGQRMITTQIQIV